MTRPLDNLPQLISYQTREDSAMANPEKPLTPDEKFWLYLGRLMRKPRNSDERFEQILAFIVVIVLIVLLFFFSWWAGFWSYYREATSVY